MEVHVTQAHAAEQLAHSLTLQTLAKLMAQRFPLLARSTRRALTATPCSTLILHAAEFSPSILLPSMPPFFLVAEATCISIVMSDPSSPSTPVLRVSLPPRKAGRNRILAEDQRGMPPTWKTQQNPRPLIFNITSVFLHTRILSRSSVHRQCCDVLLHRQTQGDRANLRILQDSTARAVLAIPPSTRASS